MATSAAEETHHKMSKKIA